MSQDRVLRISIILGWVGVALWLVFAVGGGWRWLGLFLLLGLLHPATWRMEQ